MEKTAKSHSDDYVRAIFIELYNKWWLHYSKMTVTYAVLDEAYTRGYDIVNKYKCDLALHMFIDLFKELELRRKK